MAVVAIQTHGLRVRAATLGHEVEHRQPRAGSEPVWVELSPENHPNTRSGIPPPRPRVSSCATFWTIFENPARESFVDVTPVTNAAALLPSGGHRDDSIRQNRGKP